MATRVYHLSIKKKKNAHIGCAVSVKHVDANKKNVHIESALDTTHHHGCQRRPNDHPKQTEEGSSKTSIFASVVRNHFVKPVRRDDAAERAMSCSSIS